MPSRYLISIVLCALLLIACGQDSPPPPEQSASQPVTTPAPRAEPPAAAEIPKAAARAVRPPRSAEKMQYRMRHLEKTHGDCQKNADSCAKITLDFPEFTGGGNTQTVKALNDHIVNLLLNAALSEEKPTSLEAMLENFIREYQEVGMAYGGYAPGWTDEKRISVVNIGEKIASLKFVEYSYTGGAHPNQNTSYKNYRVSDGSEITLQDLLGDNFRPQLTQIAEKVFRQRRNIPESASYNDYGYTFEGGKFVLNDNFCVLNDSLVFYYNSYEIAAYAAGPSRLAIPLERLAPVIKANSLLDR